MPGPNYMLDKGFQVQTAVGQFRCVKMGTADQTVTAVTTLGEPILGVAQEAASAGDVTNGKYINTRIMGISRCIAGGTLGRGVRVRTAADGSVVALAGVAGTSENVVGMTMFAAVSGDHVDVLLTPANTINTAVS